MSEHTIEAVVISLATAGERRSAMAAMLDPSGLRWSFFDAHECLQDADRRHDPRATRRHSGRLLARQEMAAYSSHFAALKQFADRGTCDFMLVLEDDVILDLGFPLEKLAAFCADCRIDYIKLFGKHFARAVHLGAFDRWSLIRYASSPTGAQAYLVTRAAARFFTERYWTVVRHPEFAMDRFWESKMPLYGIFPYPVIERFSPTSIPIPAHRDELNLADRIAWYGNRAIDKARKIHANLTLRAADTRMRRHLAPFDRMESSA